MPTDRIQQALRKIPQVDQLLSEPSLSEALGRFGRTEVGRALRKALEGLRAEIRDGEGRIDPARLGAERIAAEALRILREEDRPKLRRVINATGVVLHTGLGRAVLARAALAAIQAELRGYCALEVDPATGERSQREEHVAALLCERTGAEAATVVNNNAAGTMLGLAAMASGREVVVARGQLIEIGGSFRMPDVMALSGARLVEVGTTNKAYPEDFENAVTPETGLLLHVHTSNYRIVGFTREVSLEEMVAIGRRRRVAVMEDLGSGALIDLAAAGLPAEPTAPQAVRAGADLVAFSGDKLLGGPQAGILVGTREAVGRARRHPLFRAMRPGKFTLAALEATLRLYRDPERLREALPTLRMLTMTGEELEAAALELARRLEGLAAELSVEILSDVSEAGGGSLPAQNLPTRVVAIRSGRRPPDEIARLLREADPPIMTRVQRDRVLFDVRTIQTGEAEEIAGALARILPA